MGEEGGGRDVSLIVFLLGADIEQNIGFGGVEDGFGVFGGDFLVGGLVCGLHFWGGGVGGFFCAWAVDEEEGSDAKSEDREDDEKAFHRYIILGNCAVGGNIEN